VPRLYLQARPGSDYAHSLKLLKDFKARHPHIPTKSGLMVGLGETNEEILGVMRDLARARRRHAHIGQYLQPSKSHLPVLRYAHPDEFAMFAEEAKAMGFRERRERTMVRSSYHATQAKEAGAA